MQSTQSKTLSAHGVRDERECSEAAKPLAKSVQSIRNLRNAPTARSQNLRNLLNLWLKKLRNYNVIIDLCAKLR
jgi:hypothetical protein